MRVPNSGTEFRMRVSRAFGYGFGYGFGYNSGMGSGFGYRGQLEERVGSAEQLREGRELVELVRQRLQHVVRQPQLFRVSISGIKFPGMSFKHVVRQPQQFRALRFSVRGFELCGSAVLSLAIQLL